jgi:flagellar protein FlaI
MMTSKKLPLNAVCLTAGLTKVVSSDTKTQKNSPETVPEPGQESRSQTDPEPPAPSTSWIGTLPSTLGNRTRLGDVLIITTGSISVVTGYIALFIDFPVLFLGIFSVISLTALLLTAAAIRNRFRSAAPVSRKPAEATGTLPTPETPSPVPRKFHDEVDMGIPVPEERMSGTLATYWIEPPHVYIRIIQKGNVGFTYTIVEPAITFKEQVVLRETYSHLRKVIIYDNPDSPPVDPLQKDSLTRIIRMFYPGVTDERSTILSYYLKRDLSGFGPLEALMHDPALEDISCNGANLPVFVFHRSYGSLPTNILFAEAELNQFVLKLAQKANKQISLSNPVVDATLPGGSRIQVTYSNIVSLRGSSFTIRKFRADPMTPLDLIQFGTYNAEILAFLWLVIEHRRSLIIAGGTASGKTSTMNAVSLFIPQNAKIVSLEDTHEIQLPHSNWLATLTREVNTPGMQGNIDLFSLLKSSMRQRPEYIIVGEVRGKEAQTLFQAMNTGHATLSTIHAGSSREAINRLTHEPISVPPAMFTALDLVITQSMFTYSNNRIRRCLAIHEISVDGDSTINLRKLYEYDTRSDTFCKVADQSRVLDEIATMRGWTPAQVQEKLKTREEFLMVALEVPRPNIHDLANAIHDLGD